VSHQLRVLKDTKLVRFRRDGKTVYYALDDDHVSTGGALGSFSGEVTSSAIVVTLSFLHMNICSCIHDNTLPDDEVLYELADLFRVFGDSTRIKILYALHDDELCVQDIANSVQLSQSAVSHQLRGVKDTKGLQHFRGHHSSIWSMPIERMLRTWSSSSA